MCETARDSQKTGWAEDLCKQVGGRLANCRLLVWRRPHWYLQAGRGWDMWLQKIQLSQNISCSLSSVLVMPSLGRYGIASQTQSESCLLHVFPTDLRLHRCLLSLTSPSNYAAVSACQDLILHGPVVASHIRSLPWAEEDRNRPYAAPTGSTWDWAQRKYFTKCHLIWIET